MARNGRFLSLFHQGGDIRHLDACAALGRPADLEGGQARGHVHAQIGGGDGFQAAFFLAFMMLGSVT